MLSTIAVSIVSALALIVFPATIEPSVCKYYGDGDYHPEVCVEYWLESASIPADEWDEWKDVAWCESKNRPAPHGGERNVTGLMQVNIPWHLDKIARLGFEPTDLTDPIVNIIVSNEIRGASRSWKAWSCAEIMFGNGWRHESPEPIQLPAENIMRPDRARPEPF